MKRIKGGCNFGVLLYLFTQLLDVFYNVVRENQWANLEEDGGVSFLLEVVVATVAVSYTHLTLPTILLV